MESATPSAVAAPVASQAGVAERLQGLSVGEQIAVAAIIITILLALAGGIRWWVERSERIAREHRDDERIARMEQEALIAKQAVFTLSRDPEKRPLGVGSTAGDRMLLGTLWNVGMSNASLVNVRVYLNGEELPRWGSWARQQDIPVGDRLGIRFLLPFKVEAIGHDEPRLDEPLADSVVRVDVRFADASSANRMLSYCVRFDRAPLPDRWRSRQIECSANPETERPVEN